MNAPARPAFKPLTAAAPLDIDKLASQATSFAEKDGIPKQVFPRAVRPEGQGATGPAPAEVAAPIAKSIERFTVEVPSYLYEDIQKRIGIRKQTKKSIVLNAFAAAGFYVAPEDLVEDGRRGK
jgi:hypothetical protein